MGFLVGVEEDKPNGRLQASGTAEDPIHVERTQADVPLGLLVRLVGLSFLGYVVMTLLVGGYLWNRQDSQRFDDQRAFAAQLAGQNAALTRRLNSNRVAQDKRIQGAVADLCASAELRDTVIANQNAAIVALLKQIPPPVPPLVQRLIEVSQDGIQTLEPSDEKDCPLPQGSP